MKKVLLLFFLVFPILLKAQSTSPEISALDSLKKEVLLLKLDVENVQVNLVQSQKSFKRGISIATLGYSLTIAGGLMLGRKYDDAGKGLLVLGGATGITGTILMVDAFKYLGRGGRSKRAVVK